MKIVALSDTHTMQNKIEIPDGEILIHAGDAGNLGKFEEYYEIGRWFESLKDRFQYRIIVPGNHDQAFQNNAENVLRQWFDDDVICLIDDEVQLFGYKFYGCPWMPQFYNWAFMMPESELAAVYAKIPDDTEILITHSPPFGILDKPAGNGFESHRRCGSQALYDRVKQLPKLKHHIFGHLHYSYGTEKIGDVSFHNVASLNENYRVQNPPQVIEVSHDKETTVSDRDTAR